MKSTMKWPESFRGDGKASIYVGRWVRHYGLPFQMPSVFPVNTIRALRAAVAALEEGTFPAYHHAVMDGLLGERPGHR